LIQRDPKWLEDLLRWADEPCPEDAWVFRGQAARYSTVVPGYLRPAHRTFFGNRLHSLDTSIVRLLMERTDRFQATQIFGEGLPVLTQPLGPSPAAIVGGAAGPFDFTPTQADVTAALAQHYGLPTLYVDMTFDPRVAAFFATQHWIDGAFRPSPEPGRVYRWPARRKTRLVLEVEDTDRPDFGETWIDSMFEGELRDCFRVALDEARNRLPDQPSPPGLRIIDLTSMEQTVRRPHAQRAALACPIYLDGNPFRAERLVGGSAGALLPSTLDELSFTDIGGLPATETMDLPVAAGQELEEAAGVCAPALFPDRIDLGWSFFRIASLISIVSARSPDDEAAAPGLSIEELAQGDALKERLESGLDAASALVARESFRLLPGFPPDVLRRSPSLSEAGDRIRQQAAEAIEASRLMGSPENREKKRRHAMLAAQELQRSRRSVVEDFLSKVEEKTGVRLEAPDDAFPPPPRLDESAIPVDNAWVADEIRDRLAGVEQILADAARVPAYAVVDSSLLPFDPEVFPTDDDYERSVNEQAHALSRWLDCAPFASYGD